MDIYTLIKDYGDFFYLIILFWTFLEGETIVLFAGVAANKGLINLWTLIACAWTGSFLGDQLYFAIGRRWGTKMLARRPKMKKKVDSALGMVKRYSTWFILSFRFIYGVRNIASFALGMSGISWARFAILNFISAGLWAISFAGGGYLAGAALERILGDLAFEFTLLALGVFVLISLGIWGKNKMAQKKRIKEFNQLREETKTDISPSE